MESSVNHKLFSGGRRRLEGTVLAGVMASQLTVVSSSTKPSPHWRRAAALLLDAATLLVPFLLRSQAPIGLMQLKYWRSGCLAFLVIVLLIDITRLLLYGETIGKRAFDIQIVNTEGEWAAPWLIIPRYAPYLLVAALYALLGLGQLALGAAITLFIIDSLFTLRRDRRALHDIVAGTLVVRR